ncbi:MAG: ketol-acid reductoisomerase [Gammaproteobacteria bacterium]|jgi:ketol-acid reductoisomerase
MSTFYDKGCDLSIIQEEKLTIINGEYAKSFIQKGPSNYPSITAWRRNNAAHELGKLVNTFVL